MSELVTAGIDLGGTSIKYAAVTENGQVLFENKIPTNATRSKEDVIKSLADCIHELQQNFQNIACVGIGTPGLVDIEAGVVKGGAGNLPDWENIPLASILTKAVNLPVFVDNDANLMGLGEYVFGYQQKGENMIFLTIGTGIGGAIIINGDLYRGHRYAGAELGCIPIEVDNQEGLWEDFASTAAMVRRYKDRIQNENNESIDGEYIIKQYKSGEANALEVVNENVKLIGKGVAAYINIFNPECIIIGGGVSEAGEIYIDKIRTEAMKYAMDDCKEGVKILAASLGNKAGFLGAAYFAMKRFKES